MPLNALIVLFGSIMEPLKLHGEFNQIMCNSLAFSLAGIVAIIGAFDVLHGGGGVQLRRIGKIGRTLFRLGLVLALALLPFVMDWNKSPLGFVACCCVITGFDVAFTFYAVKPKALTRREKRKMLRGGESSGGEGEGKRFI